MDKHSTGGVGDKVSLVLAPLVASCGAVVPMLSGRGLGHTGGTLDKLESIPGWRASLGNEELTAALAQVGAVIAAAGDGLAPADRRLYALRDVTGTVESIPLIASSIMSKKIAEGTGALVLDVKTGAGAFMQEQERALDLARTMVALGEEHGVRTRALVTRMDTPLGRAVGNALEVAEAIEALRGEGPEDLMEVTFALAGQMLELAGIEADPRQAIASGRALDAFKADDQGPGRRPGRAAAAGGAPAGRAARPPPAAGSPGWTRGRSASPPGGWGPAGRARRTPSAIPRAYAVWPSRETTSRPGSRCLSCTPTTRPVRRRARGGRGRGDDRQRAARPGVADRRPGGSVSQVSPTLDQIRAVPKVLLHDHLDGGLRPSTVIELAEETGYR